ncbi:uncharacterized protein LOC115224495 [Argonauta hians]
MKNRIVSLGFTHNWRPNHCWIISDVLFKRRCRMQDLRRDSKTVGRRLGLAEYVTSRQRESLTSISNRSRRTGCRSKTLKSLHSRPVLILVCALVVVECICVLAELMVDLQAIRFRFENEEAELKKFVDFLKESYPDEFKSFKGKSFESVFSKLRESMALHKVYLNPENTTTKESSTAGDCFCDTTTNTQRHTERRHLQNSNNHVTLISAFKNDGTANNLAVSRTTSPSTGKKQNLTHKTKKHTNKNKSKNRKKHNQRNTNIKDSSNSNSSNSSEYINNNDDNNNTNSSTLDYYTYNSSDINSSFISNNFIEETITSSNSNSSISVNSSTTDSGVSINSSNTTIIIENSSSSSSTTSSSSSTLSSITSVYNNSDDIINSNSIDTNKNNNYYDNEEYYDDTININNYHTENNDNINKKPNNIASIKKSSTTHREAMKSPRDVTMKESTHRQKTVERKYSNSRNNAKGADNRTVTKDLPQNTSIKTGSPHISESDKYKKTRLQTEERRLHSGNMSEPPLFVLHINNIKESFYLFGHYVGKENDSRDYRKEAQYYEDEYERVHHISQGIHIGSIVILFIMVLEVSNTIR